MKFEFYLNHSHIYPHVIIPIMYPPFLVLFPGPHPVSQYGKVPPALLSTSDRKLDRDLGKSSTSFPLPSPYLVTFCCTTERVGIDLGQGEGLNTPPFVLSGVRITFGF